MYKEIDILTILHKGSTRIYFYKGYIQFLYYPKRATVNVYRGRFTYFKSVFLKSILVYCQKAYNSDYQRCNILATKVSQELKINFRDTFYKKSAISRNSQ